MIACNCLAAGNHGQKETPDFPRTAPAYINGSYIERRRSEGGRSGEGIYWRICDVNDVQPSAVSAS